MKNTLISQFPALAHPLYRKFIVAKIFSDVGTWMQRVSLGYVVFAMTGSAFWVGAMTAIEAIPLFLFVLVGGAIVDMYKRERILIATELTQLTFSAILGILVVFLTPSLLLLALVIFFFGLANALDHPARIALPPLLVPREHVASATALNITGFNIARVSGPLFAGIVIATTNPGVAFLLNALSFVPLIYFFSHTKLPESGNAGKNHSSLSHITEGFKYVYTSPVLLKCVVHLMLFVVFGISYMILMPVIAHAQFSLTPVGLGTLFAAMGSGSIIGGLWSASKLNKLGTRKTILTGVTLFVIGICCLAFSKYYALGLVSLFLIGIGHVMQMASVQSAIQLHAPDDLRGRISNIQSLVTQGMNVLAGLTAGLLATIFGHGATIVLGGCITFFSAWILFRNQTFKTTLHK